MERRAFTLVELMIVVAIIGILAAIAIPNFVDMQYRAKRAELAPNVDGIKTSEQGYDAAYDQYLLASQHPAGTPGKTLADWAGGNVGFQKLGWKPDGKVRGRYSVTTTAPTAALPGGDFVVTGIADVDGDGAQAQYTATKSIATTFNNANDTY